MQQVLSVVSTFKSRLTRSPTSVRRSRQICRRSSSCGIGALKYGTYKD
jgi:hypothetical protein